MKKTRYFYHLCSYFLIDTDRFYRQILDMMKTLCRWPNKMAAMGQPRSGHGCSHLTADGGHVIVTGRHVAP